MKEIGIMNTKKGILTDTLFQFSFFKPYSVAINLLPHNTLFIILKINTFYSIATPLDTVGQYGF